ATFVRVRRTSELKRCRLESEPSFFPLFTRVRPAVNRVKHFDEIALSAAEGIHARFAGGQAKMAARLRAIIQADGDGRSPRPAEAG
ncbi:MAG TPA: hypothetical protein VHT02_07265, partial [Methylocella sp.]|nr:hypothetical protein [Methylocella sp.]